MLTERLKEIANIDLARGAHASREDGMCITEAASYVAGEPWSDHPECVCSVIAAFLRTWNDNLPDEDRTRLLAPLIPLIIDTRATVDIATRRATMAADWLIRVNTPAWLRLAGLSQHADALSSLPEIVDFAQCPSLMPTLYAVRTDAAAASDDAWGAAWEATWDAARGDAEAGAWAAAGDAARDVALDDAVASVVAAAWDAARDAAKDIDRVIDRDTDRELATAAAKDAAWDAARAAARHIGRDALQHTTQELQASALDLIRRMIEVRP